MLCKIAHAWISAETDCVHENCWKNSLLNYTEKACSKAFFHSHAKGNFQDNFCYLTPRCVLKHDGAQEAFSLPTLQLQERGSPGCHFLVSLGPATPGAAAGSGGPDPFVLV